MNRRDFLYRLSAVGSAVMLPQLSYPNTPIEPPGFRTACVSWCFHEFGGGVDTTATIDTIGKLGFDGIQLMINTAEDLVNIWTPDKISETQTQLADNYLELASLAPFFPCYPHLGNADETLRNESLASFERFCELAQQLGTNQIEVLSPYASEFVDADNDMFQAPYGLYKIREKDYQPGKKITLDRARNLNWSAIQQRMKKVFRQMAKSAKKHNLRIVLEPHIHGVIAESSGFLLAQEKGLLNDTFSVNTDTGWVSMQTEYPPMTVHRMRDHLSIMQFRDVDRHTREFTAFGEGVVNMTDTLRALREINFTGYLSFEEVFFDSAAADAKNFIAAVRKFETTGN